jgi:signal transduction histidine kinase
MGLNMWVGDSKVRQIFIDKTPPASLLAILLTVATTGFLYVLPDLHRNATASLSLEGEWDICIPKEPRTSHFDQKGCTWQKGHLPDEKATNASINKFKWWVYRKHFETPIDCTWETSCVLVIGGVSTSVRATINGTQLGSQSTQSDIYPVQFQLPPALLNHATKNELILEVFNERIDSNSGVTQGPLMVSTSKKARRFFEAIVGERVVLPVATAIALLTLSAMTSLWMFALKQPVENAAPFFTSCAINTIFLFSASRLPRELFEYNSANSLHFATRIGMDWANFWLSCRLFRIQWRICKFIHYIFLIFVAVFLIKSTNQISFLFQILALNSTETTIGGLAFRLPDTTYLLAVSAAPLALLGVSFGILGAVRDVKIDPENKTIIALFILVLLMQLADLATFLGLIQVNSEKYFVRLYPFFLSLGFAYLILGKWLKKHRMLENMARVGSLQAQLAHDIKPSIAALRVLQSSASDLSDDSRSLLTSALKSLENNASSTLAIYSEKSDYTVIELNKFLKEFVDEASNTRSQISFFGTCNPIHIVGGSQELKRAVNNIVLNATESGIGVRIIVNVRLSGKQAVIGIENNGSKIPDTILRRLNSANFGFSSKIHGTGIGLQQVYQTVAALKGGISFKSSSTSTRVEIRLPLLS